MDKVIVTTFTDPMMGLTYEMEPVYERIAEEYPRIEYHWIMSLLVRDVSDFMLPGETIMQYNKRLAKIYESEQSVGGLPISMPELKLFDEEHRTSLPLNLAYKAAQLSDTDKADRFLWELRHATVVDVRPTTHLGEILNVVRKAGINEDEFMKHYKDGSAQAELEKDLAYTRKLNIHSLPAHLISFGEKAVLCGLMDYEDFVKTNREVSGGNEFMKEPDTVRGCEAGEVTGSASDRS